MTINISEILKLRPLQLPDAESIAKQANNKNVWKNLSDLFPHPYTLNDAINFINNQKDVSPPAVFAIVFKEIAIGTIGISVNNNNSKLCGDIGFWLGEVYWNKGIATASIKAVLKFGFETFSNINCISASVYAHNFASMKALEKAGLKKEKTIKQAVLKAGEKKDILLYRINRDNYYELRSI